MKRLKESGRGGPAVRGVDARGRTRLDVFERKRGLRAGQPPHAINPEICSGPDQISLGILETDVCLSELPEHTHQRVLHQILSIPHVAGEPAAIRMEGLAMDGDSIDEASPWAPHRTLDCEPVLGTRHAGCRPPAIRRTTMPRGYLRRGLRTTGVQQ